MSRPVKQYVPESRESRQKRTSIKMFVGMTRLATREELDSIRDAVLAEGVPLEMVDAQPGGKYGFYLVLQFSSGWSDIVKQVEIASFLQMEFGQLNGWTDGNEMVP
jgi:hypothetical protein